MCTNCFFADIWFAYHDTNVSPVLLNDKFPGGSEGGGGGGGMGSM